MKSTTQRIKQLAGEGYTRREIAAFLCLTYATITYHCRTYRIATTRGRYGSNAKVERNAALVLLLATHGAAAAAREFGISRQRAAFLRDRWSTRDAA